MLREVKKPAQGHREGEGSVCLETKSYDSKSLNYYAVPSLCCQNILFALTEGTEHSSRNVNGWLSEIFWGR